MSRQGDEQRPLEKQPHRLPQRLRCRCPTKLLTAPGFKHSSGQGLLFESKCHPSDLRAWLPFAPVEADETSLNAKGTQQLRQLLR